MKIILSHNAVVFLVFVLGIALRAVEVINGNYLFGFDHGRDYQAVYSIVETGKQTLIGAEVGAGSAGITGLFHGPGYYYLMSIVYRLFHGDPYGGLLLMFLFGVGAMILTYFAAKDMFGKRAALFSLAFVAVAPTIVPQSRFIWNHHPTSFFIPLVIWFVHKAQDKPRLFLPLALFVAGFIYHFELAIAVPLVGAILLSALFVYRIRDVWAYVLGVLGLAAAFAPMAAFEARHGFMAVRGLFGYITANSGSGGAIFGSKRLAEHGLSYWLNFRNTFFEGIYFPDLFQYAIAACLAAFAYVKLRAMRGPAARTISSLLVVIGVSWAFFLLLNNVIWDYYLIHLHFAYIFILAVAIDRLFAEKDRAHDWLRWFGVVFTFLFVVAVGTANRLYIDYSYDITDYGGFEKIKGKRAAVDYVYADAAGKPFGVGVFMPAIYTYPYDYLFATYGTMKYGYAPGTAKKGTVYLIMELDAAKPWTAKGWSETVMGGGKSLWTVKLPSGQIVEKREYPESMP